MENKKPGLYLRFPGKICEEYEVKDLCPLIKSVHIPRQKSARWCVVNFNTLEERMEATKLLKQVLIDGKKLCVKPLKMTKKSLPSEKKSDSVDSVQDLLKN